MKKVISIALAAMLAVSAVTLAGCGKKEDAQKPESVRETVPSQTKAEEYVNDVELDKRDKDLQYSYDENDLNLVDTLSGKSIALGMTASEIEAVTGDAIQTDRDYKVYDGVVVKYSDDKAVSFIVGGKFSGDSLKRYKTPRGIGIGISVADFKAAYGDEVNAAENDDINTASTAVRYFKKNGDKLEYLGAKADNISSKDPDVYIADFMFGKDSGEVTSIRISLMKDATGGK